MQILDILNSNWMMDRGRLSQMHDVYSSHMAGPKLEFKDFKIIKQPENFKIIKGAAIIPISGPLTPKTSFFDFMFGTTSFEQITKSLNEAVERSEVKNIILHMNTPGGTVQGSFELAKLIKDTREKKDVQVFSDGMIASAGMLFASAASKITISSGAVEVGSIGVIARRIDYSQMDSDIGLNVHEFVSGEYKNSFSPNKPLTEKDAEYIQSQVDFLFSMFANEVADNRNIPIEQIIELEGKILIGEQAIEAGLADEIGTLDSLLSSGVGILSTLKKGQKMTGTELEATEMTADRLKADFPAIFQQISAEGRKLGAAEERKRILGIQASAFPGQEELVQACINDASISDGDAAMKFNQAEKETKKAAGEKQNTELPEAVHTVENATSEPETKKEAKTFDALVNEHKAANSCSRRESIKAVAKSNPVEHQEHIKNINK